MTRKDYVLIAAAIREARSEEFRDGTYEGLQGVSRVAEIVGRKLESDNPRFDRERFIAACAE